MKTIIPFVLVAGALVAPAWFTLRAADTPPAQAKGRVLLLENERTLEGDIELVGDQYRIRRTLGETWVASNKVLRLCQDHREAYAYLRERANLRDPAERLRLAQWCYLHDLREESLAEVTAAARLRPDHEPTQRLLANLQRTANQPPAPRTAPPTENPATPAPPTVDVTQEALGLFVSHVQPILLNTCANCHSSGRGGSFKLTRPPAGELVGRKTLQQNLVSVLAQVNLDEPGASPLLTRAVSIHGEMKDPPLRGRQAVAYRTLEDWVRATAANHPPARPQTTGMPAAVPATALPTRFGSELPATARPNNPTLPATPSSTAVEQKEEKADVPVDLFDPAIFNGQPEKN
jgi:hypothetical protein